MSAGAVSKLVAELLVAIQALSSYSVPAEAPRVEFVTHQHLQQEACGRPCEVYGWFPPGETIYIDDRLDPAKDVVARSILLHELVHFLQQEAGTFPPGGSCETWLDREWEAYDIQIRWLAAQSASPKSWARLGLRRQRMNCRGAGRRGEPSPPIQPERG